MKTMLTFKQLSESIEAKIQKNKELSATTASTLSDDERLHLKKHYTNGSAGLNHNLIDGKSLSTDQQKAHDLILKHSKPIGRSLHLYSGTNEDFSELANNSKNKIIKSPAHISATHHFAVAQSFTDADPDYGDHGHIIHIKMEPHNKGLNSRSFGNANEHETIIPAGTKLKYSHSTFHETKRHKSPEEDEDEYNDNEMNKEKHGYHIHHFKIYHQQ